MRQVGSGFHTCACRTGCWYESHATPHRECSLNQTMSLSNQPLSEQTDRCHYSLRVLLGHQIIGYHHHRMSIWGATIHCPRCPDSSGGSKHVVVPLCGSGLKYSSPRVLRPQERNRFAILPQTTDAVSHFTETQDTYVYMGRLGTLFLPSTLTMLVFAS